MTSLSFSDIISLLFLKLSLPDAGQLLPSQDFAFKLKHYHHCVLVAQLCPTLCNPMDCTLPGSSVHGILQERYWSGLSFPSPVDLPDPRIKPRSALQASSLRIPSLNTHTHTHTHTHLAVLGLSCGMQDLYLQHANS